jgi:hypothetical protein
VEVVDTPEPKGKEDRRLVSQYVLVVNAGTVMHGPAGASQEVFLDEV